jgi:hypothetical protein
MGKSLVIMIYIPEIRISTEGIYRNSTKVGVYPRGL